MTPPVKILAIKYWILPVIWAGLIFFMSSRQGVDLPSFQYADKLVHLCIYTVFSFLVMRALVEGHSFDVYSAVILTLVIGTLYGLSDEIHQIFVPTRSAEVGDLLSDAFGSFIGALIYGYVPRISKKDRG